jgi:tetratricopeptide (TPR) repeat protein
MGREEEALVQFGQALRSHPDSDLAHYNIAEIMRKQGRYALAVEHYRAALLTNPDLREARLGLAIAAFELSRANGPK